MADAARYLVQPHVLAPRRVRKIVREACDGVIVPDRIREDAALVAGELVTSCLRQTHAPLRLEVAAQPSQITIRVHDDARNGPGESSSPGTQRSWGVVRRISSSFGWSCNEGGRELWALLRV